MSYHAGTTSFLSVRKSANLVVAFLLSTLISACTGARPSSPCVKYVSQPTHKTIMLRGHGSIDVQTETLVCVSRDHLYALE